MVTKPMSGVLVLDKPAQMTSHDLVVRVRRLLRVRAVGHAGTLDPMATGILVVAVGEATKLAGWLTAQDKVYQATISFGVQTDTLDGEGRAERFMQPSDELLEALDGSRPMAPAPLLASALERERGRNLQAPPPYSAIKIRGERAFAKARRGAAFTLEPRPVCVRRLQLLSSAAQPPFCSLEIEVSKGYYVRSLARDLAEGLGCAGHLSSLRRIRSGSFALAEAVPAAALEPNGVDSSVPPLGGIGVAPGDELRARLIPLEVAAARALSVARLTDTGAVEARHGRRVAPHQIDATASGPSAWFDPEGRLVAVGRVEADGSGRVLRGFN